eukprot:PhM_4_TR12058/c0_g1_i1/m.5102/K18041/PTP4A; protein tyrosine phosphatase type IVA
MAGTNGTLIDCDCSATTGFSGALRFLIMDAPSPSSLSAYIKEMQKHNVSHLVRVCGPTYKSDIVERAGIAVHHWQFDDGAPPPKDVVEKWLELLDTMVQRRGSGGGGGGQDVGSAPVLDGAPPTVAVHCVAGLGRAPILVAIALVEYGKFDPLDAIGHIRERRKGAINNVQLNWLMKYRRRNGNSTPACCVIC